jgi:hypothetical protein
MKTKSLIVYLFMLVCLMPAISNAQSSDSKAAKSVVKITTTSIGKDDKGKTVRLVGNGSGFCWNDKMQIVTALHVVAGIKNEDITVYTDRETRSSGAKVISVFKEADLALLELDTDLGLIPLEIEMVDHNSPEEYYIWGFPHGIFQMGGDHIRFSRSIDPPPTLNSLVNKTDFKFTLETQGYPLPKAQILRVSSTIQPGHSGAPIITRNGSVIGVADGGLRSGTARLNWAFPAHLYVPMLLNSKDPVPSAKSLQANLYASSTIVPDDADETTQNRILAEEARSNVIAGGNQEISKIWTLSYDEIMATMGEEDQVDLNEIAWEFDLNMNSTSYDVYEDFKTGATITIPAGAQMYYQNGWFMTANASQNLFYYASVYDAGNFENAINNAEAMFNATLGLQFFGRSFQWTEDDEDPDYFEEDEYWEEAGYYITRYADDVYNPDYMLIFNAEISESESLIVFLVVDLNQLDKDDEYLREFLQYSIALNLADFAGY